MVVYYGPWQEGLVHESRIHPESSDHYVPYSLPGVDKSNGLPVGKTYNGVPNTIDTDNGNAVHFPLKGQECISGGALPMLFLPEPINLYGVDSTVTMHCEGPGSFAGTPGDPGYYSPAVSLDAQTKAANNIGGNYPSGGGYSHPPDPAGVGYIHYGKRWPDYNDGSFFSAAGDHYETWGLFAQVVPLTSDVNFEHQMNYAESASTGLPYYGSVGCVPPKAEWPEGATSCQIMPSTVHNLGPFNGPIHREYLEVRFDFESAGIPVRGAYKPLGNDPAWRNYEMLPNIAQLLARPAVSDGMQLPAAEIQAWRDEGSRSGLDWTPAEYASWHERWISFGWAPVLPEAIMTPFEYPGRAWFNGPDPGPEGDNLVQIGLTGVGNRGALTGSDPEKPWAPAWTNSEGLNYSIYVKHRTPQWRFVYNEEPIIFGEPNGARRRFT